MKDKSLIFLGTVLIYCAEILRGHKSNKQDSINSALADAIKIFGITPRGVVDGRMWFEQAKQDIISRKSNGADLVKDID